jgi:hypothetical protein
VWPKVYAGILERQYKSGKDRRRETGKERRKDKEKMKPIEIN